MADHEHQRQHQRQDGFVIPSSPGAAADGVPGPEPAVSGGSGYDEAFAADGAPRRHWRDLLAVLDGLGSEEVAARVENGRRILREHGVGYAATGDTKSPERPWELDLLPLILGVDEWRTLEAGVRQRAHLLNAVLRDLYGQQRLVRDGFLPAALVQANPGYLRACQAVPAPEGRYLHIYAIDLARDAGGQWQVLADRTQAPSGMGFALENRTVVSRVLPEAMRVVRPRPLSGVLSARRDALSRLAPRHRDNPSIVLLTPGPRSEAYFEHAYLARLLGFTLVEGGDLTVRDRAILIKTLDGLQPADVVLRRVNDVFCDPLELRTDSLLGVPGLVEATRAGRVAVVNALGSGLLESPGFLPFLPGLCRRILGEELRLPSVPTWWCGRGRELSHVLSREATVAIRDAFTLHGDPIRPGRLAAGPRSAAWAELKGRPHEFVGQEPVRLSRVPVLSGRPRETQPVVLRLFAFYDGEDYSVMPGGLARVMPEEEMASMALGAGGGSKDVWLPGEEVHREEPVHIAAPVRPAARAALSLPSRTADNFFWLGRYAERLEQLARVSRCVIGRLSEDSGWGDSTRHAALNRLLERLGIVSLPPAGTGPREHLQGELLALWSNRTRAGGARELFDRIHLAAFSVRDRLSADTWRILNRLEADARLRDGQIPLVRASAVINQLVLNLAAFSGMEMENMTRGQSWTFLDCGRRIERAANLLMLLRAALECEDDLDLMLEPVLEISDSVMTHRRRHFADLRARSVMELLLTDHTNPRALAFQLVSLAGHAAALPSGVNPDGARHVREKIVALAARPMELAGIQNGQLAELHCQMIEFDLGLNEVSELLTQVYFSHTPPRVN